jgi:hypothetical protein
MVALVLVAGSSAVLISVRGAGPSSTTSGGSVTTIPGQGAVGSGYLATDSGDVIFIQWTQNGTNVHGTAEVDSLVGSPPNQSVSNKTITVTGQLQGSTITLSFDGGTEVFGTLSGGSFTVNFPQPDGSLAPVKFSSAAADQFNQALAALQGNTGASNSQAAATGKLAAEQAAIDKAASAVAGDITGLQSDVSSMSGSLSTFTKTLAQQQTDLAAEAALEQQVINESKNGTDNNQVCSDSNTVATDSDTVDSDGDTVSADANTTEGDINGVRDDIARLQKDFASLQADQAALPSYSSGLPTQSAVNQAVAGAQQAITNVLGTANADIAQANAYQTQGYQDAQTAASAGDCAGPAQPFTQPTIR